VPTRAHTKLPCECTFMWIVGVHSGLLKIRVSVVRLRAAQQAETQRRQIAAARERAASEAQQALQQAAQLKEQAWQRYYRKPPNCETAEGPAFVECANHYIRAKRAFEAPYAAGKIYEAR
jgi:hypothetical protein